MKIKLEKKESQNKIKMAAKSKMAAEKLTKSPLAAHRYLGLLFGVGT
jgi:hypothetical protein